MPDFDIDFCQDRRDEVIRYVQERLRPRPRRADHHLRQAAGARGAARRRPRAADALRPGRPLCQDGAEQPRQSGDAEGGDRRRADAAAGAGRTTPVVRRMLEIALKLEGLYRHASTHAAGVVIGDRPLDELVPLYRDPRSDMPVTQFNMKDVEKAGLVKFDFLGLKTLTVLQTAVEHVQKSTRHRRSTCDTCRSTTRRPSSMLAKADATGVFQLESSGMRDVLQEAEARPLRGHHRRGGALSPRPDGQHPALHQLQARQGRAGLPASLARRHPEGDLRHHDLPGTGDADRPGAVRLHAGRRRPAAPRHGQEDQGGDGGAAQGLHRRRGREQGQCRQGRRRSSTRSTSSPATASTRATPPPMRWSPTRPPG